jgi:hypothetical protein
MSYVLPRAVIVLVGWGLTYFILTALSTHLPPMVVYLTGFGWLFAGLACFGYLYRLRHDAALSHNRSLASRAVAPGGEAN